MQVSRSVDRSIDTGGLLSCLRFVICCLSVNGTCVICHTRGLLFSHSRIPLEWRASGLTIDLGLSKGFDFVQFGAGLSIQSWSLS